MLIPYENRQVFISSQPVDIRMSIDGLSAFVRNQNHTSLHDGSLYVFYNRNLDKVKILFWDRNGFVVYYKRLDKCKFILSKMLNAMEAITAEDLEILLAGFEPKHFPKDSTVRSILEHKA